MDTLEQRVERLERSCRRWRLGFLILSVVGVAGTAGSRTRRWMAVCAFDGSKPDRFEASRMGRLFRASCEKDVSSIKLASPAAATVVALVAQKDSANMFVSRNTAKGLSGSRAGADDESGFVDLRTADGKNKEIEPE